MPPINFPNMKPKLLTFIILLASCIACNKNESLVSLDVNKEFSFSGTFETINSENLNETVDLSISKGYYLCFTSLPYGRGAGEVEANTTKINFIDTLFFVVPALYGPSYVLSGEHFYTFDGENLKIWKEKNVGSVQYDLRLSKTN